MKTPFYLAFATIAAFFAASASAIELGWTAGPMASDGSTIRTDGTLVYAYSSSGGTVGNVTFTRAVSFSAATMVSATPTAAGSRGGSFGGEGVAGDFGDMLKNGWYWDDGDSSNTDYSYTLTLMGLEVGHTYLVQLVAHRQSNNMMVSANGTTPVHVRGETEANCKYGASIVGVFVASDATEDITVTYTVRAGDRPLNAIQVRDLGASGGGGGGNPVETPVYTLTIPAKTGLVLDSVTTNGVAVAVANDACSIVSNTTVTINFTAASGYEITSGNPVVLTVTGDKTLAEGEYPVVQEEGCSGGGENPVVPVADGWTAVAMGATSASIRTDGTLLYAYARENYTVNGVAFVSEGTDGINNANCTVDIVHDAGNKPPNDTEEGGYKELLGKGWYASAATRTFTLRNLTSGKRYLVQIIASRSDFTTQSATAPDGVAVIKFGGTGWEYGGSLVGIFTASDTTKEFTVTYAGNSWLNGIQVRELGANPPARKGVLISVY